MIALTKLSKSYGQPALKLRPPGRQVLQDAELQIHPGESVCIVGGPGSGKSTLFRILTREEHPDAGDITIDGVSLFALPEPLLQLLRSRMGLIFDAPRLSSHLTIAENVSLPLHLRFLPAVTIENRTTDILQRLNLAEHAHDFPASLSHSEQMLAAIARALVGEPMILLADEPFAELSPEQIALVQPLIAALQKHGTTLIFFGRNDAASDIFGLQTVTLNDGVLQRLRKMKQREQVPHHILEHDAGDDAPMNGVPSPKKGNVKITSIGG